MVEPLADDVLSMPKPAREFLASCHLMVANAILDEELRRDRGIDEALATAGVEESVDFAVYASYFGKRVPAGWLPAVVALMTVDNPFLSLDELVGGVAHRRIDALLDLFQSRYCAHEMQGFFAHIVAALPEAGKDPRKAALVQTSRLAVAVGTGFAGGWFGYPLAGVHAVKAIDLLFAADGEQPQALIEASKVVLCHHEFPSEQQSETALEETARLAAGGTAYVLAEEIRRQGGFRAPKSLWEAHRAWMGAYYLLGGNLAGG